MSPTFLILAVSILGCTACSSSTVVLDYDETAPQAQSRTLLLPVSGPGGDEEMEQALEKALIVNFSTIPGAEVARKVGLYDRLRSEWDYAMDQMMEGSAQGEILDSGIQEAFVQIGELTGVDSVFIAAVSGSSNSYEAGQPVRLACGLWDIKTRKFAWRAQLEDAQGLIPVPLGAFAANCAAEVKAAVDERRAED